jgi:hypothetical protein
MFVYLSRSKVKKLPHSLDDQLRIDNFEVGNTEGKPDNSLNDSFNTLPQVPEYCFRGLSLLLG